jgi:uncharacterized protein (UPF0332 family)
MTAALRIEESDWIAATAYYARYFALYALLMKIGIKSEIHDCTINLAGLLSKKGIIPQQLAEDIAQAKQTRIDTQYYVETEQNPAAIKRNVEAARKFVLETEKAIENLTDEQINSLRLQIRSLEQK